MLAAMLLVLTTAGAGFADRPPEEDRADVAALVQSQSDFAFALYARLSGANEGRDLFFSPFSLATALTMAAEGARGETADGMGQALRFPEAARRSGADAARLP
jgi:serine protease inhibitor